MIVSILAHPERWALPKRHDDTLVEIKFQSSPTPKGGRYFFDRRVKVVGHTFQSSPTPKGGRYIRPSNSINSWSWFQSSPTPKGGRYVSNCNSTERCCGFNPRPPRKVGATRSMSYESRRHCVSILAHPERWALRYKRPRSQAWLMFQSSPTPKGGRYGHALDGAWCYRSFNPRPPRKVGATPKGTVTIGELIVSILAHPERWALHRLNGIGRDGLQVSILAHPERWALRYKRPRSQAWLMFQSSPTPKGGRYGHALDGAWCYRSFNPRPPRKVGATPKGTVTIGELIVSILAHPERWALHRLNGIGRDGLQVSILAHPERWALHARHDRHGADVGCFNPRPPRKVGATTGLIGRAETEIKVSILAHPERWALPGRDLVRH